MSGLNPVFWPFEVLPREQLTHQHLKEIGFLEDAHAQGYRPCKFVDGEYRAESPDGRTGWIICRGGYTKAGPTRWEIWLNSPNSLRAACWVNDFECAAAMVLGWLQGEDPETALARATGHTIRGPSIYPETAMTGEPAGLTPP